MAVRFCGAQLFHFRREMQVSFLSAAEPIRRTATIVYCSRFCRLPDPPGPDGSIQVKSLLCLGSAETMYDREKKDVKKDMYVIKTYGGGIR